jgi:hypothetical protein
LQEIREINQLPFTTSFIRKQDLPPPPLTPPSHRTKKRKNQPTTRSNNSYTRSHQSVLTPKSCLNISRVFQNANFRNKSLRSTEIKKQILVKKKKFPATDNEGRVYVKSSLPPEVMTTRPIQLANITIKIQSFTTTPNVGVKTLTRASQKYP